MATISEKPKLVTVFGGSGFIGRYVVQALAKRGYRVRVACRNPHTAIHIMPLGNVGQVHAMQANLRHRWSIDRAVEGADHVINLVGILHESGRQTFSSVQAEGARAVAEAAKAAGARITHMSAIGADADSPAEYGRTKAAGEQAVLDVDKKAVILRPSIVFGPGRRFFQPLRQYGALLPLPAADRWRTYPVPAGLCRRCGRSIRALRRRPVEAGRCL